MNSWKKFVGFAVILVAISAVFLRFPPDEIVSMIGIGNSLLVAFLVSLLGGVSTLTSASFFAVIGGLALGGVPIGLLMLISGPALLIGDSVFYYFGKSAHGILPSRMQKWLDRVDDWIQGGHDGLIQGFVIIYTGFTPFPGDILMFILALSKYKFRRIVGPLLLGNMLLVWSIAWVALGGSSLWSQIFK